ncbi:unknown; predicted coding region [Mycoplasmopsis pulmonis]|uniref:Uncharacterized protein n=1 Tax=Mycoplasmopsis pulmonis (strain UAB CTIP) TaxID=272635 RepID=Q98R76_MYCPU|nr:unknown; predicted coding region [Mycoplasmopsis pulmonis]
MSNLILELALLLFLFFKVFGVLIPEKKFKKHYSFFIFWKELFCYLLDFF